MSLLLAMLLSSITARGVINPIVVAAPAGEDSALYFVLRNSAGSEDRLLGVTCACAERVEIHNMVTRDGGRHMDVEPAVIMPAARLVEIRPGGSRHLMLLRLTRPLVAGETVPMTFLYADRTQTVNVRVVADSRAGWAAGLEGRGPRRLAPLEALAGSCWRGTFPDGRRIETRCFSAAYGMFMQDRQVIEGGAAPATGYTIYSHDVMGMTTRYEYRGPDGVRRGGRLVPAPDGVTFEDYPPDPSREISTRTAWTRDGADAWIVRGEDRRSRGWRELWRLRMVRAGPSPAL
jgi:copper(I)-binding protein